MPEPTADRASARPRVAVLADGDLAATAAPFSSRWLEAHYELSPVRLPAGSPGTLVGRLVFGARVARALLKARPRLVHLRCDAPGSIERHGTCLDVTRFLGLPTVVEVTHEHWVGALERLPPRALARMQRRFARADVCLARDDAAADALQRRLGRTAEIVTADER